MTVVATPASAADGDAAKNGRYCTGTQELQNDYEYTKLYSCITVRDDGFTIETNTWEMQHWDNGWWYPTADYPMTWSATGTVSWSDGNSVEYRNSLTQKQKNAGDSQDFDQALSCGNVTITRDYRQTGPHLGNRYHLDNWATPSLNVPCA
jgi:hypothetical protein